MLFALPVVAFYVLKKKIWVIIRIQEAYGEEMLAVSMAAAL